MKATMNTDQTNTFAHAVAHLTSGIYSLDWADVRNDISEDGSVIAEVCVSMPDTNYSHWYRFFIAADGTMSVRDHNCNRTVFDIVNINTARVARTF